MTITYVTTGSRLCISVDPERGVGYYNRPAPSNGYHIEVRNEAFFISESALKKAKAQSRAHNKRGK